MGIEELTRVRDMYSSQSITHRAIDELIFLRKNGETYTKADVEALVAIALAARDMKPDCAQPSLPAGSLAAAIEDAQRTVAGWPEDVRAAMGVQPERQVATTFEQLQAALQADDAYAWSWHCNMAMPMLDAKQGLTHRQANECAAAVMEHMFRIDVRKSSDWQSTFQQPDAEPTSPPPADDIIAGLRKVREAAWACRWRDECVAIDRAIAALGEKQDVTFFKCTFDGDPPSPHKNWMDWGASRMYTNVLIRAHEFGVPVTDALGEKGKTR